MRFDIDFSELKKLAADMATEVAVSSGKAEAAVETATERLYARATADAPVETGELKSDIKRDTSRLARRVYATVRQAFFQEYGTSRMAPHPFLVIHAERAWADLEQEMARIKWGFAE